MDQAFLEGLGVTSPEAVEAILQRVQEKDCAWQEKLELEGAAHARAREQMILEHGITLQGGRNVKAISALLDTEAIFQAEDTKLALEQALQTLKADCGYLFQEPPIPSFSRLAGAGEQVLYQPVTLAGALRARMKKG